MKRDLCLPDKSHITQEILAYLLEHPEAQDTLDGIVQWWLLDRKIRYQQKKVKEAIGDLVAKEIIIEQKKPGRESRYRVNRDKAQEIKEFIQGS